jgi:O-antigen ligase
MRAMLVLGALAALFPLVAPDAVLERLSTIGDTKESSANARLTAWATAMRMIADNPGLGVGMRNFQSRFLDYSDEPEQVGHTYVAHNSYLQIWAESGTPAFVCYLLLLGSVFFACRHVMRLAANRPDLAWAGIYARMMETTNVGFMVGAFWLSLVTALSLVAQAAYARAPEAVAGERARGPRRITVRHGARQRDRELGVSGAALAHTAPRWR